MPLYKYKVSSPDGKVSELLIEGDSESDSLSRLRQRGLLPLKSFGQINAASGRSGAFAFGSKFDPVDFTNRLAPLLKAHIPLERALGIVAEGMDEGNAKSVVSDLRRGLHEGKKLSVLIRNQGRLFPGIYANLIEAGEETGALAEVVQELQRFLNERKELKNFLITSSIYPAIILSVVALVIVLLLTVFIPLFSNMFEQMGKSMPLLTVMMVKVSDTFIFLWWLWILLITGLIILIYRIRQGGPAKIWWDNTVLKIPLLGDLVCFIEISRFIRTLAVLLQHHVHLLSTIKIASKVIQNSKIANTFSGLSSELKEGSKLSKALSRSSYVPKLAVQMLQIGEESGETGEMLNEVAGQFESMIKDKIKRLMAFFEPVIILVIAFIVMIVVLSVFLAILQMNQI